MSDPRLPVPGLDIPGLFLAAQRMREGRQNEEMNRLRLMQMKAQMEQGPDPMARRRAELEMAGQEADLAGKYQQQSEGRSKIADEWRARLALHGTSRGGDENLPGLTQNQGG